MAQITTAKLPSAGYNTEYKDNYDWNQAKATASSWKKSTSGLFEETGGERSYPARAPSQGKIEVGNIEFQSTQYPSVYRENVLHKDDRGKYIDPFKGYASKPYGRRLMYDQEHPQKMYASQWSSELADTPGIYSFPTTTGLQAQQPWTTDMTWRMEGEEGNWPSEGWKQWTEIAECPPYDGHSDQPQYNKYKVQVP